MKVLKLQCHMKHMKSRYIRTSETSETPMTAICHDMMLMKFNLFLDHHHMTGNVELLNSTQCINATNLQLKMKDLRLQTVRMVQVWNRFEPPRKQACVFQIYIYIYLNIWCIMLYLAFVSIKIYRRLLQQISYSRSLLY